MEYFGDVYLKRLNRYGNDYQSRVQGQRERLFEDYLMKSIYKVDFEFEDTLHFGSLERDKQNNTQLLHFLLTKRDLNIPPGTVLFLKDGSGIDQPWMIYWLEKIQMSGYNRYVVLKMTHYLTWTARDGSVNNSWGYMYGQQDNMLKDELRSRSRSAAVYTENLKLSFIIMPFNSKIRRDDYLEITIEDLVEAYTVTGYDIQSSEGIVHVTVDPRYLRDHTDPPTPDPEVPGDDDDYYWFGG